MRTNIDLDKHLVDAGLKLTKLPTMKALVNYALEELLRRKSRLALLPFLGSHCWKGSLNKMRS